MSHISDFVSFGLANEIAFNVCRTRKSDDRLMASLPEQNVATADLCTKIVLYAKLIFICRLDRNLAKSAPLGEPGLTLFSWHQVIHLLIGAL